MFNKKFGISSAFSLLEITVALALFSIAVTILTQGFLNSMYGLQLLKKENPKDMHIAFLRKQVLSSKSLSDLKKGGVIMTIDKKPVKWQAKAKQKNEIVKDFYKIKIMYEFKNEDDKSIIHRETVFDFNGKWSKKDAKEYKNPIKILKKFNFKV